MLCNANHTHFSLQFGINTTVYYLSRNVKQPILSSSYLGFGNGSLARDTDEIEKLMDYLVCHHSAKEFAMVGHSTGCQNSIHFLKNGRKDVVERVQVCLYVCCY